MNDVAGRETPFQRSRSSVERIDVAVATSEIDRATPECRRRKIHVERIRHRFSDRLRAVQVRPFKAPLARRLELPFYFAVLRIERVKIPVVTVEVDETVCNGGRRD